MMSIAEFCNRHDACEDGREWALANCADLAEAWEKAPATWLIWAAWDARSAARDAADAAAGAAAGAAARDAQAAYLRREIPNPARNCS